MTPHVASYLAFRLGLVTLAAVLLFIFGRWLVRELWPVDDVHVGGAPYEVDDQEQTQICTSEPRLVRPYLTGSIR